MESKEPCGVMGFVCSVCRLALPALGFANLLQAGAGKTILAYELFLARPLNL
jgi:hypothetical protein